MAFENMEQAAEALANAVNTPESADSGQGVLPDTQPGMAPQSPANQPGESVQGDLGDQGDGQTPFTPSREIDLSGLPPEAREYITAREREMQAGFTRATQEAAEARREAEQAVAFVTELNSNPDFALQVVSHLSNQLQSLGYTPAEANAMASAQVTNVGDQAQPDESAYGDDPYLAEIQSVQERTARIEQSLAQQEVRQREAMYEAQLERMAAKIQTDNPSWQERDMARVFNMAYAYGGDLFKAAEDYKAIRQDSIEAYMNSKASTPPALSTPGATGAAQQSPQKFESLDDPRLEQAAQNMLRNALG